MTPLPDKCKLKVLLNPVTGKVMKLASNIAPEVDVETTFDPAEFKEAAKGLSFQSK